MPIFDKITENDDFLLLKRGLKKKIFIFCELSKSLLSQWKFLSQKNKASVKKRQKPLFFCTYKNRNSKGVDI